MVAEPAFANQMPRQLPEVHETWTIKFASKFQSKIEIVRRSDTIGIDCHQDAATENSYGTIGIFARSRYELWRARAEPLAMPIPQ
jgi:hypothetical protein